MFNSKKKFLLFLSFLITGFIAITIPASAAPFSMSLDNARINLGFAFQDQTVLPAPSEVPANPDGIPPTGIIPLPDLWEARATSSVPGLFGGTPSSFKPAGCATPVTFGLYNAIVPPSVVPVPTSAPNSGAPVPGSVPPVPTTPEGNPDYPCAGNPADATVSGNLSDDGDVAINSPSDTSAVTQFGLPSGFQFPIMTVPNPLGPTPGPAIVPLSIASSGNIVGEYNSDNGHLVLNGPFEARVLTGLSTNPLGSYCSIRLAGLQLSTNSNDTYPGVPFTNGIDGSGALTGTYNIQKDAVSVGGADCTNVNTVTKGVGSIWISNGITEPATCPVNTTGVPPNCLPVPCPAGSIGNEPNCVKSNAKLNRISIQGPKRAKRGKAVVYRIKLTNSGNSPINWVRIKVRGQGVAVNSPVNRINAGATRTVNVRVRPHRAGRIKVRFVAVPNNRIKQRAVRVLNVR
jgi:hypothetical protein